MVLVVRYYPRNNGIQQSYAFPDHFIPKLYSGVLKVEEPTEILVPPLGSEEKDIKVAPTIVHAIFSGDFTVTYEETANV